MLESNSIVAVLNLVLNDYHWMQKTGSVPVSKTNSLATMIDKIQHSIEEAGQIQTDMELNRSLATRISAKYTTLRALVMTALAPDPQLDALKQTLSPSAIRTAEREANKQLPPTTQPSVQLPPTVPMPTRKNLTPAVQPTQVTLPAVPSVTLSKKETR